MNEVKLEVDMMVVPNKRYKELLEAELELNALKAHGVDNWDGYLDALYAADLIDEEDEDDV